VPTAADFPAMSIEVMMRKGLRHELTDFDDRMGRVKL
jgi:hypothetical protein